MSLECGHCAAGGRAASCIQASLPAHLMQGLTSHGMTATRYRVTMHPLSNGPTTTCIVVLCFEVASPHDASRTCDDTVTVLQPTWITLHGHPVVCALAIHSMHSNKASIHGLRLPSRVHISTCAAFGRQGASLLQDVNSLFQVFVLLCALFHCVKHNPQTKRYKGTGEPA